MNIIIFMVDKNDKKLHSPPTTIKDCIYLVYSENFFSTFLINITNVVKNGEKF